MTPQEFLFQIALGGTTVANPGRELSKIKIQKAREGTYHITYGDNPVLDTYTLSKAQFNAYYLGIKHAFRTVGLEPPQLLEKSQTAHNR